MKRNELDLERTMTVQGLRVYSPNFHGDVFVEREGVVLRISRAPNGGMEITCDNGVFTPWRVNCLPAIRVNSKLKP